MIDSLPAELLLEILLYLPLHFLPRIFSVSSAFSAFVTNEPFWHHLYTTRFESSYLLTTNDVENSQISYRERIRFIVSRERLHVPFFEYGGFPTGKFVMLGESGVGKSTFVKRYFDPAICCTRYDEAVAPAFRNRTFESGLSVSVSPAIVVPGLLEQKISVDVEESFGVHVYDTAGQERYKSLAPLYYRDSSGIILVFDLARGETFDKAIGWLKDAIRQLFLVHPNPNSVDQKRLLVALVGNKKDLVVEGTPRSGVRREDVEALVAGVKRGGDGTRLRSYASKVEMEYFETSSKTCEGVREVFDWVFARAAAYWFSPRAVEARKRQGESKSDLGDSGESEGDQFELKKKNERRCIVS